MLLSASGYLVLLTVFMLGGIVYGGLVGSGALPDRLVDDRDLLALFGWVGLTISGVSTIVVPSHFGVTLGPRLLPRLHLTLTNVGILGFFALSLASAPPVLADGFLGLAVLSFLVFGIVNLRTLWPFLGGRGAGVVRGGPGAPQGPSDRGVPGHT